jgi:sugar fermentation stimulation protein A
MRFEKPLRSARLIRRYKRFLADIVFEDTGEAFTIHCPNPGAMLGLGDEGMRVWLRPAKNPTAKLPFAWELVELESGLVGIDTGRPNPLAEAAILAGAIPELAGYETLRREVRYGENSRIDLFLTDPAKPDCYVEIKNVHLERGGRAEFPDSKTARGAKHLAELANMAEAGHRAVMLYIIQRSDCSSFALASDIDPTYAAAYTDARSRGVETLCYDCSITLEGIELRGTVPIAIP